MRQLFIGVFMALPFGGQAYTIDVPKEVQKTFKKMYPDAAEVEWDYFEEDETYIAFFDNAGYQSEAYFKEKGEWVKTFTQVDMDDLPEKALDHIYLKFQDVDEFIATSKVEEPKGTYFLITFEVEDEEHTITFDSAGKQIDL